MSEQKICPYPGLRPFTEEESIYFKGREEHIDKIIAQLEEKKFVMLTGASGDGKSSIVYAGVIPNARAGFFKAKFNNWLIADFRPERSPLKNMSVALAGQLGYDDAYFVEKELGFGFSSLIKLYKNSPYYLDQNSKTWNDADEKEKKSLKRKAANLFILVDQFEEFFTNSENYHNGKASVNSQAVLNLLLETAKISLSEDLPIYIICTMRSDYIGQCAAFRGLPEYIGFSQFFVPRLKRKEIHQVIEEPAILSGNKISNRLTETLINEIGEGFDQLPVLQHALNQVWTQADKGNEEMDLIHLAKLSGLPQNYLPENDKQKFADWFKNIPEFKKAFFKNPSLESVLNSHANELYETASDYYNNRHEENINRETAYLIIKTVFQCLTKIDDARAVRNRMTLEELTQIINDPNINPEMVGGILDYFRLQGNTFLKPFILSEETSGPLKNNDVLDITHESLIRNWDLLTQWAKEEHENFLNFQDFNKQLQRWLSSDKDKGYLLAIGPLTFFDKWYNECKPNKYWLARYDESDESKEEKLKKAEETLLQASEFLKKSARTLFFSRYVLKHGANKLLTYVGIIILVISCSYYYFDFRTKQNDSVIEELENRSLDLLYSNKVANEYKSEFVIKYERLHPSSFAGLLNDLDNDSLAFDIADNMFASVQNFETRLDTNEIINPLVYPLLQYMDERLDNLTNRQRNSFKTKKTFNLGRINKFLSLCAYVKSYDDNKKINKLIDKNSWVLDKMLNGLLGLSPDSVQINVSQFNNSIQLLLAIAPETDFNYYINKLSPFENDDEAWRRFVKLYPYEKTDKAATNLGYPLVAYLYCTEFTSDTLNIKIKACFNAIWKYHPNIFLGEGDYYYSKIMSTLMRYNNNSRIKTEAVLNFAGYSASTEILKVFEKLIGNNFNNHIPFEEINKPPNGNTNFTKYFCNKNQRDMVWDHYAYILSNEKRNDKTVTEVSYDASGNEIVTPKAGYNINDFKFYQALYYKKRGTYCLEVYNQNEEANKYFNLAIASYNEIPKPYLNTFYELGTHDLGSDNKEDFSFSFVFNYPKVMNEYSVKRWEGKIFYTMTFPYGTLNSQSQSTAFFSFMLRNKLTDYYCSEEGIKSLEKYCRFNFNNDFKKDSVFYSIIGIINELTGKISGLREKIDIDFVTMALINQSFEKKDTATAFNLFSKLDLKRILENIRNKASETQNILLLDNIAKHLAINNKLNESFILINSKTNPINRRNLLTDIAFELQFKGPVENTFIYLDSVFKDNDLDKQPKFGMKLLRILAMIGSNPMINMAKVLMKNVPELIKPKAMVNFIGGVAYNGYYYKAMNNIPEYVSSNKELQLYNEILETEIQNRIKQNKKQNKSSGWESIDKRAHQFYGLDYEGAGGDVKFDSLD